jgi:hypothetical protein
VLRVALTHTCSVASCAFYHYSLPSAERGSQSSLYCFWVRIVGESAHAGPELDLSLHGEHGGLLDASKRLHGDHSSGSTGYLPKLSVPLFGANDGGL